LEIVKNFFTKINKSVKYLKFQIVNSGLSMVFFDQKSFETKNPLSTNLSNRKTVNCIITLDSFWNIY